MNEQQQRKTLREDETVAMIFVLLVILFAGLWWFFGLLRGTPTPVKQPPAISELIAPTPKGQPGNVNPKDLLAMDEQNYETGMVNLKGQGVPNSEIEVYLNERKVGKVTVDAHGIWTEQVNITKPGRYQMFARSLNSDGSFSDSKPFTFKIVDKATVALTSTPLSLTPTATKIPPTIVVATSTPVLTNAQAPIIVSPTKDAILPFGELLFAGQGTPNTSFNLIFDNGSLVKTATVQGDGKWSMLFPIGTLGSGDHTVMTQIKAGDVELASESVSFALQQPLPSRWQPGTNGHVGKKGVYTVRGTGQPNWRIAYQIGNTPLALANTDANGNWSVEYDFNEPREYVMQVLSVDADGSTIGSADVAKVIIFDPTKVPDSGQPATTPIITTTTKPNSLVESTPVLNSTEDAALVTPTVSAESTPVLTSTEAAALVTPTVSAESTPILTSTEEAALVTPTVSAESTPILTSTEEAALVTPTVSAESTPILTSTEEAALVTPTVSAESTPTLTSTEEATDLVTPTISAESTPTLTSTEATALVTPTVAATELASGMIYDQLQANGNYKTLLAAIDATGLKEMLQDPNERLTLFAPTDEQFANLPEGVVESWLANPEILKGILLNHTVSREWTTADLAEVAQWAEPQLVSLDKKALPVTSSADGEITVDSADVKEEILSDNGVIHPIRQLLLPLSADVIKPVIDDSGVPTFRGRNLTIVGTGTPNTLIHVELNGQSYSSAQVSADGRWIVDGSVAPGNYQIIAYTYKPDSGSASGVLCAISDPVMLNVSE